MNLVLAAPRTMETHGNDSRVDHQLDPQLDPLDALAPLGPIDSTAPQARLAPQRPLGRNDLSDLPAVPSRSTSDTPEDVAILYSWANLQGAKYRDFSATRREYRAQMRRRAAELLHQQELRAQAQFEAVPPPPATALSPQEPTAALELVTNSEPELPTLPPDLQAATIEAEPIPFEPVPAEPTPASSIPLQPAPEPVPEPDQVDPPASPSASATAPAPVILAALAAMQDSRALHDEAEREKTRSEHPLENLQDSRSESESAQPEQPEHPLSEQTPIDAWAATPAPEPVPESLTAEPEPLAAEQSAEPSAASPAEPDSLLPAQPEPAQHQPLPDLHSQSAVPAPPSTPQQPRPAPKYTQDPLLDGPAWLYSPQEPFSNRPRVVIPSVSARIVDTLQTSKERVAARWYALKGVFQQNPPNVSHDYRELQQDGNRPPVLAVFSLAGGVGKTSIVATLGRTLSSMDERVLLADTTTHGLLPYYYGASEVHPGVLRTFWPPSGCKDAPVQLVNYDVDRRSQLHTREERKSEDSPSHDKLLDDLARNSRGTHRILLDLAATSSWVVRRVARMNPTILLPIAADMNSVITLRSVTRFFQSITDSEGRPLQPYFVLNQFDNKLPLHLDVREVLIQQLGERLLPFVIHRSPAMSEALAEGMTIVDYDPDSIVVQDFNNLANWVRSISSPANPTSEHTRWSEK